MNAALNFLACSLITIASVMLCIPAVADTAAAFDEGKHFRGAIDAGSAARSGAFNLNGSTYGVGDVTNMSTAQGATNGLTNPPEAALSNNSTLDPSTAYNAGNSAGDAGRMVVDAFSHRPTYNISPSTDPLLRGSQTVQNDPQAFAGTLDASYSSCRTITVNGGSSYDIRTCQESREMLSGVCENALNITVNAETTSSCINGAILASANDGCIRRSGTDWHNAVSYALCNTARPGYQQLAAITGVSIGAFGSSGCGSYRAPDPTYSSFPKYWVPETNTALPTYLGSYNGDIYYNGGCEGDACTYRILRNIYFTYPACPGNTIAGDTLYAGVYSDGWVYERQLGNGACYILDSPAWSGSDCNGGTSYLYREIDNAYIPGCYAVASTRQPSGYVDLGGNHTLSFSRARQSTTYSIASESWSNGCTGTASSAVCTMGSESCVDGPSTRNINGLDVTRACWKYQQTYNCIGANGVSNCQTLRDAGCTQLSSQCVSTNANGACASYDQTYQCLVSPGSSSTVTSCGNSMTCLNGNCFDTTAPPNQDFALAATSMNIIKEMGQDYDPDTLQIFKGQQYGCKKTFLDISNCCGDSGWALDANLTSCSSEEQQLAQNARDGRCHRVGSFCSDKTVLGVCVQTKVRWCCFNSKLARIINEQGRPQLNRGWGSAESPDCSGFTTAEVQRLDFSRMDLSEFYNDVMATAKLLDAGQMTTTISDRVTNYYNTGTYSIQANDAAPYDSSSAPPVQ